MADYRILTEADYQILLEMVRWYRSQGPTPPQSSSPSLPSFSPPEVYLANGTVASGATAGCDVKALSSSSTVVDRGFQVSVYNPFSSSVSGNLLAIRDKWGSWFPILPATGGASSLTVKEQDNTPTYTTVSTLIFNQGDGFQLSQPSTGQAQVSLLSATQSQKGIVDLADQLWLGNKSTDMNHVLGLANGATTPTDYIWLGNWNPGDGNFYYGLNRKNISMLLLDGGATARVIVKGVYSIVSGGIVVNGVTGTGGGGDTFKGGICTALGSGGGSGTVTSVTVSPGTGLAGGGTVTTSGTITLSLSTPVSQANGGTGIDTSAATNGQILIGKTSDHSLNLATLTAGSGITITNGAGSITITVNLTTSNLPPTPTASLGTTLTVSGTRSWTKISVSYTDLQIAGTSRTITLCGMPARSCQHLIGYVVRTAFTMSTGSMATCNLGYSGGDVTAAVVSRYGGIGTLGAVTVDRAYVSTNMPDTQNMTSTWNLTFQANTTGASLNNLTAGDLDIWVEASQPG
jgi:hypothetical protein